MADTKLKALVDAGHDAMVAHLKSRNLASAAQTSA
jgi:hypothetical protein